MNYGAARIVFRRKAVTYNGITFNLNFGGGTKHYAGEDTLFIRDCLKKGLTVIAVPVAIATLKNERESTWFKGYDEKYFFDKGVLLKLAHPVLATPFALYLALRHRNFQGNNLNITDSFKEILKGKVDFKNDKFAIVHVGVGKISFSTDDLVNNIKAVISALKEAKPEGVKGKYIKNIYLTSTMGPSFVISIDK